MSKTCRLHIDADAVQEATQKSSDSFGRFRTAINILETIEQNSMRSGYELEIMKRHFHKAVAAFESMGVLTTQRSKETEIPEKKRVDSLMQKYGIRIFSFGDLKKSAIDIDDEDEDPIFINDEQVNDYFVYYLDNIYKAREEIARKYYQALLSSTSVPRYSSNPNKAAEELIIKGSIPDGLDPDQVFELLGETLPSVILAACKEITFRPYSDSEAKIRDELGEDTGLFYGGLWLGRGAAEINTRHILTPERLRHVVTHEIGHGLIEVLTMSDLNAFEMAREAEPMHLTEYVKFNAEHFPDRLASEDFAESFALYFNDPSKLQKQSPTRHKYLQQYLKTLR